MLKTISLVAILPALTFAFFIPFPISAPAPASNQVSEVSEVSKDLSFQKDNSKICSFVDYVDTVLCNSTESDSMSFNRTQNDTKEYKNNFQNIKNKNSSIEQEFKCIHYFIEVINQYFQVKKTFDGCRSDIVLRPIDCMEDLWLGIQVKSTCKKGNRGEYDFKLNGINLLAIKLVQKSSTSSSVGLLPGTFINDSLSRNPS